MINDELGITLKRLQVVTGQPYAIRRRTANGLGLRQAGSMLHASSTFASGGFCPLYGWLCCGCC
eukprot:scaffold13390_cov116-Isochrysis_galbana.AAC.3